MKLKSFLLMALVLTLLSMTVLSCVPVTANPVPTTGQGAPLFINLTSDEPHRVNMALSFGMKQLDRGHPLTVFLNDRGVHVGSTANADQFTEQQKTIAALLEKGAVVFICPMCMEHYGIAEGDVLPGLQVSNPDAIGEYLFEPYARTLSW